MPGMQSLKAIPLFVKEQCGFLPLLQHDWSCVIIPLSMLTDSMFFTESAPWPILQYLWNVVCMMYISLSVFVIVLLIKFTKVKNQINWIKKDFWGKSYERTLSAAVAAEVIDMLQVTGDRWHLTSDTWPPMKKKIKKKLN